MSGFDLVPFVAGHAAPIARAHGRADVVEAIAGSLHMGVTAVRGGAVHGFGVLSWDGRVWWVAVWIGPGLRAAPITLARIARRALDAARAAEIDAVHAVLDPTIPRAAAWATALGFRETADTIDGINRVWRWTPSR